MFAIAATIKSGEDGPKVVNLQAALLLLLERGIFKSFDPSDHPSADDLKALAEKLRAEQSAQVFGEATRQLLVYFQVQQGLGDHLRGVVEEPTAKALNELLGQHGVVFEPVDYLVKGRVTDTQGRPRSGLKVVAYDRDLRRHQRLGDASTDAEGRYAIGYQIEDFRRAEGQASSSADLFVVVLPDDGLEPLATSEVRLNAKPVEIIDLAVLALDKEPSEFERVASLVTPLLKGQGTPREVHHVVTDPIPTDLQPYELNAEDIEFLVHETGLDAAALQAWAEGARWQREALRLLGADEQPGDVAAINVHGWPFFFAWIRAGQSPGLMGVLRSEAQGWLSVQRNGEALARIPPANTEDWKLLVAVLQELARLAAVDDTLNSGEPLVEMLRQSPDALPRELKLDVLNIYRTEGLGNPDAFLKLTDKHPTAAKELGTFVRTLRLNDLTGGQAPLIGALNKHLGDKGDSIRALADLGAADWEGLVKKAGGQGFAVDAALYATVAVGLQLRVEQLHPVPALIARIGDDSVKLDDPDLGALRNVLTTHDDAADALLKGIDLDSPEVKAIDNLKVIDTLRNFGRFGRLGLGFEGAAHLHNSGVPSPGDLMRYGSGQIRNILMNKYPQEIVDAFTNNVTNAVADIN